MKQETKTNQLKQRAEAFRIITQIWLKRYDANILAKTNGLSEETTIDRPLEFDYEQDEAALIFEIQQEAMGLNPVELNQLRIRLAKAFLKEVDNKLARDREDRG